MSHNTMLDTFYKALIMSVKVHTQQVKPHTQNYGQENLAAIMQTHTQAHTGVDYISGKGQSKNCSFLKRCNVDVRHSDKR